MSTSTSLFIAPQWLGDAVMTEPLLRRLHARGERLTVAALRHIAPIYRAMPQVEKVIELEFTRGRLQLRERYALGQSLRGQFTRAYLGPNSLKSALVPFFARIPVRVGYTGEMRLGLLTQRLANPTSHIPMVGFYSALSGEPLEALTNDQPMLTVQAGEVVATLARFQLSAQSYTVFAPGAEYGPAKRWPVQHWALLADQLNGPVVLLGSAKERNLCEDIVRASAATVKSHNLAGHTSVPEAMHLISASQHVVSNDSGLMHVAAGLGVKQVAIFGSSSPLHTPPLNPAAQVLWLKADATYLPPLDCAPCFERNCRFGHTRCLSDITPQRVVQALSHTNP